MPKSSEQPQSTSEQSGKIEEGPKIRKMNFAELKERVADEKSSSASFFAVFPHGEKLYFYYDADRKKFMFPASPDEAMSAIPEVAPSHEIREDFFEKLDTRGGHFEELQ